MQNKYVPVYDVLVIGGGPAGLMAAGNAAALGAKTLLLEKTYRIGSKLLLSGGGRCNVTNIAEQSEFIQAFGENGNFLYPSFSSFSNTDLISFLGRYGVPTRTDPDGKVFPENDQAQCILSTLRKFAEENRVRILHNSEVESLMFSENNENKVCGVKLTTNSTFPAKTIIVATGGLSYPQTGSTGTGYKLAQQCGHTITPLLPGLVPLESNSRFIKDLQGLTLKKINISVVIDGKVATSQMGDLLFTHFGVSGPKILILSHIAVNALEQGKTVDISINLKPQYENEFPSQLQKELISAGARSLWQYLEIVLPRTLAPVIADMCNEIKTKPCASLNKREIAKIAELFTNFVVHITKPRPIEEATITCGGVKLDEVDPQTLQSRKNSTIFFCGEVLDLAAITGGFNLQESFSTGYLAGQSAAKYAKSVNIKNIE